MYNSTSLNYTKSIIEKFEVLIMPRTGSFQSEVVRRNFEKNLQITKQKKDSHKYCHYATCLHLYWENRLMELDKRLGIKPQTIR